MGRSRKFTFTCNNYTFDDLASVILIADEAEYVICGFEVGAKGTPHLQGFIYFANARSYSNVQKKLPRCSLVESNGSIISNIGYCSKDGEYWESNDPPQQGKTKYRDLAYIMQKPEVQFHLYTQYRKAFKEYELEKKKEHERLLMVCSSKNLFDMADSYRDAGETVIITEDPENYDGETVLFTKYLDMSSQQFHVDQWIRGYPPKIKRGYQLIPFDPSIIVLVYDDDYSYKKLAKKFGDQIYGFL